LVKNYTLLLSSIKSTLEKQLSISRKSTIIKDKEQLPFNRFLLIVIFYQTTLLLFLITIFLSYLYFNWQSKSVSEIRNIKQVINSNFEQYNEIINIINSKIDDNNYDLKDLLDIKKYNQLLGLQKNYVNINDAYIVTMYKENKVSYSEYGKELFTILPSKDFFSRLESMSHISACVENNVVFIGKSIGHGFYGKNAFIILKLDLEKFIKEISTFISLTGSFSFDIPNDDKYSIPYDFNLFLKYTPQSLYKVIGSKISIIYIMLLLLMVSSLIWMIKSGQLFKNIVNSFSLEQSKYKEQNITLTQNLSYLNGYKNNLESSFVANRKFFYELLSMYKRPFLNNLNIENLIEEKELVGVAKIITDCKDILYKELFENGIECIIKITTETSVDQEKAVTLRILLINFLYRALYKTPKKGKIFIKLYKSKNQIFIRIEDNGFDLIVKNNGIDNSYNLFALSDHLLEELATYNNIKIIKLSKAENNVIDLILYDKIYTDFETLPKHKNVIIFPKNE
jgi:hypothetical protein